MIQKPTRLTEKPLKNKLILLHGNWGWLLGRIRQVHPSHPRGNTQVRYPGITMYQHLELDMYGVDTDTRGSWVLYKGTKKRKDEK